MPELRQLVTNLIGEKVMGWNKETRPNNTESAAYYAEFWVDESGVAMVPVNFWNPAKDFKQAWEVVCSLRERAIIGIVQEKGKFRSTLNGLDVENCESDALALCSACLLAVGVELAGIYVGLEE